MVLSGLDRNQVNAVSWQSHSLSRELNAARNAILAQSVITVQLLPQDLSDKAGEQQMPVLFLAEKKRELRDGRREKYHLS